MAGVEDGAVQVSYVDKDADRRESMRRFKAGEARVLINVSVVGRGFDCPAASCLVDCMPFALAAHEYIQRLGRVLRPENGEARTGEYATVMDHAGNWQRLFGRVQHFWAHGVSTLLPDPEKDPERKIRRAKVREVWRCSNDECPGTGLVDLKMIACPFCGTQRKSGERRAQAWDCPCGERLNEIGSNCRKCGEPMGDWDAGASDIDGPVVMADWECPLCGTPNPGTEPYCEVAGCDGAKEERFIEVAGKVKEWTQGEPQGVQEGVDLKKPSLYAWCHLMECALRNKLKGAGRVTPLRIEKASKLALAVYKEAFGCWPARGWPDHPPREPEIDPVISAWWSQRMQAFAEKMRAENSWRRR